MAKRVTHKFRMAYGFTGLWAWTKCSKAVEVERAKRSWKGVRCKLCLKRRPKAKPR